MRPMRRKRMDTLVITANTFRRDEFYGLPSPNNQRPYHKKLLTRHVLQEDRHCSVERSSFRGHIIVQGFVGTNSLISDELGILNTVKIDDLVVDGLGAPLGQFQIVILFTDVIGVPDNKNLRFWQFADPGNDLRDNRLVAVTDRVAVEVEEDQGIFFLDQVILLLGQQLAGLDEVNLYRRCRHLQRLPLQVLGQQGDLE